MQSIAPQLLEAAIKLGHEPCKDGCIHADATEANVKVITDEIAKCMTYAIAEGISPALMIYSAAMHVGYRLRQLETEPPTTTIH
jgi:xanthine/uracil/vitamin C permease (AzgA family)